MPRERLNAFGGNFILSISEGERQAEACRAVSRP
jgi:hypothetical protein